MSLAQDVGDIVGAESAGRGSFFNGAGDVFGAVLPNQFEQFGDLAGQRPAGICRVAKISFHKNARTQSVERVEQPLLCLRTSRRGPLFSEDFFEALSSERLAATPRARITDDFLNTVVNRDGA